MRTQNARGKPWQRKLVQNLKGRWIKFSRISRLLLSPKVAFALESEHKRKDIIMFELEKLPVPDKMGYFCHPDICESSEGDSVRTICKKAGFASAFVEMESDAPELIEAYEAGDIEAPARWAPTVPEGKGWALVAKYDTEDGPAAMFVKPE
jgi:hypothetical protein